MLAAIREPDILQILTLPDTDDDWQADLQRFEAGDVTLTRKSAGETSIKAVQRLLVFLGYSTSSTGAFAIDGDFGRGTNRGVAQFQLEHGLNAATRRNTLCYPCTWQTARKNIVAIPDTRLTVETLGAMLDVAREAIRNNEVTCGSFDEALFQLNSLHQRRFYSCKQILEKYGNLADRAAQEENIRPEWILTIIKQETAGVVRPRFEQHWLTKFNTREPDADFAELRYRSMSFGLGQVMGFNFDQVGAPSARAMFNSPLEDQVRFVARFLAPRREVVSKSNPTENDFRTVARFYNGPGFAKHHYHESIQRWFREFKMLT